MPKGNPLNMPAKKKSIKTLKKYCILRWICIKYHQASVCGAKYFTEKKKWQNETKGQQYPEPLTKKSNKENTCPHPSLNET